MAKNYEELKLSDDFMFGKVMEDGVLCQEVLECLLGKPVGELTEIQPQREYRYAMDGKPIRLDIYTGNGETVYDAEMQNLNHKKPEDYDLPQTEPVLPGSDGYRPPEEEPVISEPAGD